MGRTFVDRQGDDFPTIRPRDVVQIEHPCLDACPFRSDTGGDLDPTAHRGRGRLESEPELAQVVIVVIPLGAIPERLGDLCRVHAGPVVGDPYRGSSGLVVEVDRNVPGTRTDAFVDQVRHRLIEVVPDVAQRLDRARRVRDDVKAVSPIQLLPLEAVMLAARYPRKRREWRNIMCAIRTANS
nr:hypothetical protein [Yimella lutea]